MGRVGGGFGKDLVALGASWAVLGGLFVMLVFGVVFESALKGILAEFLLDFERFGKDFGKVLGGFLEDFSSSLGNSALLWPFLGYCLAIPTSPGGMWRPAQVGGIGRKAFTISSTETR